ncbi:hypothetical protein MD588_00210 [Photobacterium sp. SDRW27]|uniref:hypothetical protein n=1 Tax=Photobacterium obscurum TaxID=2829490 RepID=UPI0022431B0D|nr:hypothetical protein [Photobacterium obscurum]MCW8327222.1 hypothetical protein [Photobacterium obscurum]
MQSTLIKNDHAQAKAQPFHPLLKSSAYFFGIAILLAISAFSIHLEVIHISGNVGEDSLVEQLQEFYLLIVGTLFAAVAIKHKAQRNFAILASAFFYIMLIRELDGLFDQISHGFWKYPAWLLATMAIGFAWSNKKQTVNQLVKYTQHRSFGLMLAGVATLLVFARIYGMGVLWQGAMQENYMRSVKNLAEEGTELLAYSLILFSAAWYCLPELFKKKQ